MRTLRPRSKLQLNLYHGYNRAQRSKTWCPLYWEYVRLEKARTCAEQCVELFMHFGCNFEKNTPHDVSQEKIREHQPVTWNGHVWKWFAIHPIPLRRRRKWEHVLCEHFEDFRGRPEGSRYVRYNSDIPGKILTAITKKMTMSGKTKYLLSLRTQWFTLQKQHQNNNKNQMLQSSFCVGCPPPDGSRSRPSKIHLLKNRYNISTSLAGICPGWKTAVGCRLRTAWRRRGSRWGPKHALTSMQIEEGGRKNFELPSPQQPRAINHPSFESPQTSLSPLFRPPWIPLYSNTSQWEA